jgi:phytol kinase
VLADDGPGALVIATAILGLFGAAELSKRLLGTEVESTRKATHLGAGAVVMSFPWLFSHDITIVALALAFAGVLIGGRITGMLGSIHDVERSTGGAYYYPFAVLGTWLLSGGDALLFCAPLAVMAVADAGAAIVGQRAGETTYRVMDGNRSVEGSMAFFSLAFTVVLVGCSLAGRPGWPAILLVTLVVATLTTAVEAVSIRGSDNLAIPYAAWLALDSTQRLGLAQLGDWILGMGFGLLVLGATATRARLSVAGGVTVFLVTTLAWALGGLQWVVPLAALYAMYLLARPPGTDTELDMVFPSTAGSMIVVLLGVHTGANLFGPYLASVAANGAIAMWGVARWRHWPRVPSAFVGAAVPVACARLFGPAPVLAPILLAALGLLIFGALTGTGLGGRRIVAALVCAAAAWAVA